MHTILVILVAELVDSDLPSLEKVSGSFDHVVSKSCRVTVVAARISSSRIQLQSLSNVAALESLLIDR